MDDPRMLKISIDDAISLFDDFLSNRQGLGITYESSSVPGGMAWDITSPLQQGPLGRVELRGVKDSTLITMHLPALPELPRAESRWELERFKQLAVMQREAWDGLANMLVGLVMGWLDTLPETDHSDSTDTEALTKRLPHPDIRARQEQVKSLWMDGLLDREIAEQLNVSPETVKNDREAMGLKSKPKKSA